MLVSALTLSFSIAHATDWLEKGGVGKQDPSEPSLQMPLHFVAGYTQFLNDCEDDDIKIVTPVSCGVYGISTDGGFVYTLRYIDGGTIGGKNAWKVHDFTRIPRMEKEGLIMYKNDDTRQLYLIKPTGAVEALPKKYVVADEKSLCTKCNYKTARLWTKPGRVMMAPKVEKAEEPVAQTTDTVNVTGPTNKSTVNIYEETLPAGALDDASAAPMPTDPSAYGAPETTTTANPYDAAPVAGTAADPYGTTANNNPYDMPYDQYDASSAQQ